MSLASVTFGREGLALRLPVQTLTLRAGQQRTVEAAVPWAKPHLWSTEDPYLYRLVSTVAEQSDSGASRSSAVPASGSDLPRLPRHPEGARPRPLDVARTRFGFREVWTDGPRFVLNGTPMKLFGTSAWSMDSWGAARAHAARMKRAGTRIMRLHTQPWQEHILSARASMTTA